jgi:hypothetical protein
MKTANLYPQLPFLLSKLNEVRTKLAPKFNWKPSIYKFDFHSKSDNVVKYLYPEGIGIIQTGTKIIQMNNDVYHSKISALFVKRCDIGNVTQNQILFTLITMELNGSVLDSSLFDVRVQSL